MTWAVIASWELRRRAVVGGRTVDGAGRPLRDPSRLALNAVPAGRRYACHLRRDGCFFFLDVPPGAYSLDRSNHDDKVVQSRQVVVAPYVDDTRMPVVWIDLGPMDEGHAP